MAGFQAAGSSTFVRCSHSVQAVGGACLWLPFCWLPRCFVSCSLQTLRQAGLLCLTWRSNGTRWRAPFIFNVRHHSDMREVQALIQDLESPNSSVRDKAALALMDALDERAVEPLLRAISKPENANHRGTLVYALSAFNCEAYLEVVVDLALTGNYEVSAGACGILGESAKSAGSIRRIRAQLNKYNQSMLLAEHHHMVWEELHELIEAESGSAP